MHTLLHKVIPLLFKKYDCVPVLSLNIESLKVKALISKLTHAKEMTTKSNQFQASLRYVNFVSINPRAITFTADSKV